VNGGWQCPIFAGICLDDAGGVDASPPFDAGPPGDGGITCGTKECSAATQYCNIVGGGVALPDAGSNMSWTCEALPAMPCDAGTGCACIPNACNCVDDGGAITNECFYP
jgi:hypothetical protein